ncbi:hypothetical protein ACMHYB_02030 [Sorangium sp. So ce1128]
MPAFGDAVLPESPADALRAGRFHRVPVLSGATQDEGWLFVALFHELAGAPVMPQRRGELLVEAFGEAAEQVEARYSIEAYESPALAWATVITDRVWWRATQEQNRWLPAHHDEARTLPCSRHPDHEAEHPGYFECSGCKPEQHTKLKPPSRRGHAEQEQDVDRRPEHVDSCDDCGDTPEYHSVISRSIYVERSVEVPWCIRQGTDTTQQVRARAGR